MNKLHAEIKSEIVTPEIPLMDSLFLSVVQDGQMWKLLEIPYNFASMHLGTPKLLMQDESMTEVEYQFKIAASDRMFK